MHMTIGVFGNGEFIKKLGKQGTVNDLSIYNHGSSEGVFTYIAVSSDKIQSLLQAVNMIDFPLLVISELTPAVGEQIVAISEFGFEKGFMLLDGVAEEQVKPLIKGTCIENFQLVADAVEFMQAAKSTNPQRPNDLLVPIDNYFNVKSVGTVALGIVKGGTINKHDKVIIEPLGKEVLVKGIQSQDRDIDSAGAGTRVGLNMKGIEADELKRGYVIGAVKKAKTLKLNFTKSKYSREALKEGEQVFVSSMLQVVPGRIKTTQPLEIELENPICYRDDTKFLIASTKQQMPRIMGKASL